MRPHRYTRRQPNVGAKILKSQSTPNHTLIKDNNEYFIKCNRSGEKETVMKIRYNNQQHTSKVTLIREGKLFNHYEGDGTYNIKRSNKTGRTWLYTKDFDRATYKGYMFETAKSEIL